MAEWLEGLDRNPTNDELVEWYKRGFLSDVSNRSNKQVSSGICML